MNKPSGSKYSIGNLIGPEFIAKDIDSYDAMVEGYPESEELFWQRIERLKAKDMSDE